MATRRIMARSAPPQSRAPDDGSRSTARTPPVPPMGSRQHDGRQMPSFPMSVVSLGGRHAEQQKGHDPQQAAQPRPAHRGRWPPLASLFRRRAGGLSRGPGRWWRRWLWLPPARLRSGAGSAQALPGGGVRHIPRRRCPLASRTAPQFSHWIGSVMVSLPAVAVAGSVCRSAQPPPVGTPGLAMSSRRTSVSWAPKRYL